jgi:hypothetical protein
MTQLVDDAVASAILYQTQCVILPVFFFAIGS